MSAVSSFVKDLDAAKAKKAETARTRMRDIANTLLADETFADWAGDAMRDHSYFGEGRELTPYQQGLRGGVVRLFETLVEASDNGPEFLARVFREKIMNTEKKR